MIYYCDNHRHLICKPYSIENLHKMAQELGIERCWFHSKPKKKLCHYDIPKNRIEEIQAKCIIVPYKGIVKIIRDEQSHSNGS